jgi:hypothetical protein
MFVFLLNRFPILKRYIIQLLYFFTHIINFRIKEFTTKYFIYPIFISEKKETFFGYYDKSPVNKEMSYILYNESIKGTYKCPSSKKHIDIIIQSINQPKKYFRFSTTAYNWQQGARAQWIDNERVIFNDYNIKDEFYYSKIVNGKSGNIEKILKYPIYDVHGNTGFSLDFDRLAIMRPDYGYRNRLERGIPVDITNRNNNGIFKVDLLKNEQKLIISFERLCDFEPKENMKGSTHKVNHIMISPDGNSIIFLHIYFKNGRKFDRLILYNENRDSLKLLADHEMVSHCFWYGSKKIVAFMNDFNLGDKYYIIDIESCNKQVLGNRLIDTFGDGHPNILGDLMLFDTYPNQLHMKELFIYDIKKSKLEKLGEFYTPFRYYGETRCDLHPRWSPDGRKVFFDSIHSGCRRLYMMDILE